MCTTSTSVTTELLVGGLPGSSYVTQWTSLGNSHSESVSVTTSWTKTSTTSTNHTTSSTFSAGLSEVVTIPFIVGESKTTATTEFSTTTITSVQDTISETEKQSTTVECKTTMDCSDGYLYQWKTSATDVGTDESSSIQTCWFACIPMDKYQEVPTPQCPAGACSSPECKCCNQYWSNVQDPSRIDYRITIDGVTGTCVPDDAHTAPVTPAGGHPSFA